MKPIIKFDSSLTPEEAKKLVEKEMPRVKKAVAKAIKKKPVEVIKSMTLDEIFGKPSKKAFYEAVKGSPSKKTAGRKQLEKASRKANRGT